MAIRYFKKEIPKRPVYLVDGSQIKFDTEDGAIGYYKTEKDGEITALLTLISEHRGGVYSISQEEYERDWVKKKAPLTPSAPNSQWREELGGGVAQDTLSKRIDPEPPAAAAAIKPVPPPSPPPAAEKRPMRPPNVGRRQ